MTIKNTSNATHRIEKNQHFSTCDLGLAAALLSLNYQLVNLDKTNPKKVAFVFANTNNPGRLADDYWNNKIEIPAQTYWNTIKRLKNQLYSN